MNLTHPLEALRHHVTGAIERGEAEAVTEVTARATHNAPLAHVVAYEDHLKAQRRTTLFRQHERRQGSRRRLVA